MNTFMKTAQLFIILCKSTEHLNIKIRLLLNKIYRNTNINENLKLKKRSARLRFTQILARF